ncbi:TonB family protein [Massilia atriviolacea]|nr:TonB family protein [Massilia atriviolacea]
MARLNLPACAKPVYPKQSLREEQQGTVTLAFLIGTDGAVKDSKIVTSSGFPLLDQAAQDGIGRCKFLPTRINGKAEEAWMKMQYVWTLGDPTPAQAAATLAHARLNAERGKPESQYQLGTILMNTSNPAHNQAEAMDWLRKAADQGYARAQLMLGAIMQAGRAGKPDAEQAMAWYRKAAEQGMPEAQHALALALLVGDRPEDTSTAVDWLHRAATQGYARSQAVYGALLTDQSAPESVAQGIDLLRKAAAQGDAYGQLELARNYGAGRGMERNDAEAAVWYERAALGGNKQAQRTLAELYQRGQGVAADAAKAARWQKAADAPPARPR